MFCTNCGTALENPAAACSNCGMQQVTKTEVVNIIPAENRPLSPWAYFGLQILFAIPVVGFIFLIVFSCSRANINRRNFARSYWCSLILLPFIVAAIYLYAYGIIALG